MPSTRARSCPRPITARSSSPSRSCASSPTCHGAYTGRGSSSATRVTGEMDKIDGPYYFFKAIQRMRQVLPEWVPLVGIDLGATNVVPVDWVAAALDHIAHQPDLDGRAFHLTDPRAQRVEELFNELAKAAHAPRFARQRRQTAHRCAAALAALARASRCRRCASCGASALRRARHPRGGARPHRADADFDTQQAQQALQGSPLEQPPALQRVCGAPVGLLGARDGPAHRRALDARGAARQARPDHRRLVRDRAGGGFEDRRGGRGAAARRAQRREARGTARRDRRRRRDRVRVRRRHLRHGVGRRSSSSACSPTIATSTCSSTTPGARSAARSRSATTASTTSNARCSSTTSARSS